MTNIGCGLCEAPEGTNKMNVNIEMDGELKVLTVLGRCACVQSWSNRGYSSSRAFPMWIVNWGLNYKSHTRE